VTAVRLGVIGLGLIGGSIVQQLAQRSSDYSILGFDADEATRRAASRAGLELAFSARELAASADLVLVALPPEPTAAAVVEALAANRDALVTDVASVKAPVLERVRQRAPAELDRFLPGHPLAGAETTGWGSARPDLLEETVWAVCPPHDGAPAELLCRWAAVFDAFDARLVVCDPLEHDVAVARTSHAPHLVAEVMAASLGDGTPAELAAALSGRAFRDMTRIARSNPALWNEILRLNGDDVASVVDDWIEHLAKLRAALRGGDIWETWSRGKSMVELVERLRWQPPSWQRQTFEWPAWDELLALGRAGVAVRRLAAAQGRVSAEVGTRR
jgi:prephenate dehydrogenase